MNNALEKDMEGNGHRRSFYLKHKEKEFLQKKSEARNGRREKKERIKIERTSQELYAQHNSSGSSARI